MWMWLLDINLLHIYCIFAKKRSIFWNENFQISHMVHMIQIMWNDMFNIFKFS
jgi:hypothetical protein